MKTIRLDIFICVVAVLLAAVVAAYYVGKHQTQEVVSETVVSDTDSKQEASEAAVVKRVSQQMEDIAYQQKAISDKQRDRAEEQSKLALRMRDRAELESKAAREAESKAKEAADEAERERANALNHQKMAEEQRDQATLSKSITDTLSYRTLARTLANTALTQHESGNTELASLLTSASWHYTDKYKGNAYQPELFSALTFCSEAQESTQMPRGGSVQGICAMGENGCVAVTDYGEVEWQKEPGKHGVMLVQDPSYNFCDVWSDGVLIYALTLHGPLCIITQDKGCQPIKLPAGTYRKMLAVGEGKILLAAKDFVCWFDCVSGKVGKTIPLNHTLSTIVKHKEDFYVFFSDGTGAKMDMEGKINPFPIPLGCVVSAAYYDEASQMLFLGDDKGNILTVDKEDWIVGSLQGHISAVTSMTMVDKILVSAAYDKSVLVWDLSRQGEQNMLPANLSYQAWPQVVCKVNDTQAMVGCSNGLVQRIDVSVTDMAAKVKNGLKREFTPEEWSQYVGANIPMVTFQ